MKEKRTVPVNKKKVIYNTLIVIFSLVIIFYVFLTTFKQFPITNWMSKGTFKTESVMLHKIILAFVTGAGY